MKGQRLMVAGSAALHKRILHSDTPVHPRVAHLARRWRPNDLDVWCVNAWNVSAESQCIARRIASSLGMDYELSSDESYDLEQCDPYHPLRFRTLACDVRSLVFAYRGRKVGKINIIGTESPPGGSPYRLDPRDILRGFDFNCCRVGYLCRAKPREEQPAFIYADESDFEACVATGVATYDGAWWHRFVGGAECDQGTSSAHDEACARLLARRVWSRRFVGEWWQRYEGEFPHSDADARSAPRTLHEIPDARILCGRRDARHDGRSAEA